LVGVLVVAWARDDRTTGSADSLLGAPTFYIARFGPQMALPEQQDLEHLLEPL
jgi:hypothetical protein